MHRNLSLAFSLILVGWAASGEAQVLKPPDAQPAVRLVSPAEKAVTSTDSPGVSGPSAADPGTKNPVANSPVNTINMGQKPPGLFNPATKFPGAGGASGSQGTSGQTTPGIPVAKPLGGDRKNVGPQSPLGGKGTKVGPDYFSRERQLKDLTDPKAGMKDVGAGGMKGKSPLDRKSGADLLGGIPTTVAPGDGKNRVSVRDQQKDDPPGTQTVTSVDGLGVKEVMKTFPNGKTEKTTTNPHLDTREVIETNKGGWSYVSNYQHGQLVRSIINFPDGKQEITTYNAATYKYEKHTIHFGAPDKKEPNPETDTGEGHNPKGGLLGEVEKAPKSPSELEAERSRQVTLPGEGPSQPERVYLSQEDALQGGVGKMTDGRIDPGDPTAAAPTGGGQGATPRPGFGPERVDGRVGQPGLQGGTLVTPQVAPPTGGNTPDNPTASQDSESPPLPASSATGE
ncbi:MAG: hypothetical protein ACYC9Y_01460 [Candidatus Methylomirabilia bacterium]